jgi:hypothetical protein
MSDEPVAAGWYPDPFSHAAHRWWDGVTWTSHVANAGELGEDPVSAPAPPGAVPAVAPSASGAAIASAATGAALRSAVGGAGLGGPGWQVVVGPTLPSFPALTSVAGRRGIGRLTQHPALLLAVTTLLAVGPALVTDTAGASILALPRLAVGLVAALAAAMAPRLSGRARMAAIALPLVFVGLQLVAAVSTWTAMSDGDSGLGAAGPHLLGTAVTVIAAMRALAGLRHTRSPS